MNISSPLAVAIVAALVFVATPAQAQSRHDGWNAPRPANCDAYLDWRDRQRCYDNASKGNIDAGAAIGAGIVGLTLGAIIAGAANDRDRDRNREVTNYDRWLSYCSNRYRSFDPRSGTFLGFDGRRHRCE